MSAEDDPDSIREATEMTIRAAAFKANGVIDACAPTKIARATFVVV